jgi:hypothetical protein
MERRQVNIFKGAPWTLPDEQAQKQLKQFLIAGWVIAAVALFAFGWVAIASLAAGGRCVVLSWHKGNAGRPNGMWLKAASVLLVVLSALELILVYGVRK